MGRIVTAAACLVALLGGAATASAADVGANDDSAKFAADGGVALYTDMVDNGLEQTVIGVRFKPSEPMQIQDKQLLDRAIPNAIDAGLHVVLAIYPYPPREIEAGLGSPALFGAYVSTVVRAYPQVRQFVLGNEANQPAFWRPQFSHKGVNVSAAAFGRYLAAGYDAVKAVDPELKVVGIGLSPRGNDKPRAKSNISTSPIRFLRALGAWYRASGRTQPLMDSFSFHPYPNSAKDSLDRGYGWPNAGFVNLDRIKQALWDAFNRTAQPTTLTGLKLHLDEIGWQVDTRRLSGYTGAENVPVTDELTQARIYGDLIRRAACDPDVESVSFFGFRDDGAPNGIPGSAPARRRDAATGGRGRPGGDRGHRGGVPRHGGHLGPDRGGRRRPRPARRRDERGSHGAHPRGRGRQGTRVRAEGGPPVGRLGGAHRANGGRGRRSSVLDGKCRREPPARRAGGDVRFRPTPGGDRRHAPGAGERQAQVAPR